MTQRDTQVLQIEQNLPGKECLESELLPHREGPFLFETNSKVQLLWPT